MKVKSSVSDTIVLGKTSESYESAAQQDAAARVNQLIAVCNEMQIRGSFVLICPYFAQLTSGSY